MCCDSWKKGGGWLWLGKVLAGIFFDKSSHETASLSACIVF